MSRNRIAACSALALALAASVPLAADAQQLTRAGSRARPVVITQEDIMDAEARGDGFAQSGQFALARREFRAASALQLRMRELPTVAMWQVANAYYAEHQLGRAAETLDELAAIAAVHGQRDVQAKALLEAAFLHRAAGHAQRAHDIGKQLREMCKRGEIDGELHAAVMKRLAR